MTAWKRVAVTIERLKATGFGDAKNKAERRGPGRGLPFSEENSRWAAIHDFVPKSGLTTSGPNGASNAPITNDSKRSDTCGSPPGG